MLKGTKGHRDTLKGKRKENVHKGGRQARSMKKGKKGKKNKNKGKEGTKNLTKKKRGVKKKEEKKRITRKKMQAKKAKQSGGTDCKDEEGWVMIVEGGIKRENPYVIMEKTCLSELPKSSITAYSDQAQVYFKQGSGRWQFELTVKPSNRSTPSKCLEDCEWKEMCTITELAFGESVVGTYQIRAVLVLVMMETSRGVFDFNSPWHWSPRTYPALTTAFLMLRRRYTKRHARITSARQ